MDGWTVDVAELLEQRLDIDTKMLEDGKADEKVILAQVVISDKNHHIDKRKGTRKELGYVFRWCPIVGWSETLRFRSALQRDLLSNFVDFRDFSNVIEGGAFGQIREDDINRWRQWLSRTKWCGHGRKLTER